MPGYGKSALHVDPFPSHAHGQVSVTMTTRDWPESWQMLLRSGREASEKQHGTGVKDQVCLMGSHPGMNEKRR